MALSTAACAGLLKLGHEGLPDHAEVRLVRAKTQHYQICIRTIYAVTSVRIVSRL